jgi:hypothetical protein
MKDDAATKIKAIESAYCRNTDSVDVLCVWIKQCVQRFYLKVANEDKYTHRFKDCHIEFLSKQLLFSITKAEGTSEYIDHGVVYDVGISVKPYLKTLYGIDEMVTIRDTISLEEADFTELSIEIGKDVNTWCVNVDTVFKNLSSAFQKV